MTLSITVDDEVTLRLVQPEHAAAIFEVVEANREAIGQWMPWVHAMRDASDEERWIRGALRDFADRKGLPLTVLYRGEIVGGTGWTDWKMEHNEAWQTDIRSADIGYWLAEKAQGRGIMTRAVWRLAELAFDEYFMHRLTIRAEPENAPSWSVAERAGFRLEGTMRHVLDYSGRKIDHRLYAMTVADWRAVQFKGALVFQADLGNGVKLRQVDQDDAPALFTLYANNRDRFRPWFRWAPTVTTTGEVRRAIADWTNLYRNTGGLTCVIERNHAIVGMAYMVRVTRDHGRVELGYWLDQAATGQGLVTSACRVLIDHAFNELHANRIDLRAALENEPSQGVARRLGFVRESVTQAARQVNGAMVDVVSYRLLRDEWEAAPSPV